jgi:mono/diheme cytochrome c family protein
LHSHAQNNVVAHGKHVFEKNNCVTCHGKDGTEPFDLTVRVDSLSDRHLRDFIKDPAAFGNRRMPAFRSVLSDPDIEAVIAYVRALSNSAGKNRKTKK